MLIEIISFMAIGAFTGIAAGLLGIGGGLIIVPFTLMVFDYLTGHQDFNIPHELQAHVAIAGDFYSPNMVIAGICRFSNAGQY